ncbi:tripartite-type tricarboxylate transporter receptor subunit TctC [Variovorax sp. TBS-050B]|uniref:Bug family tripartite tricarboxylate transporter substrate binding protein n=1 Tax=Variovorax sp. TBS-050B TaxID=2940551 RepID=UPI002475A55C|nr:tripartite tricarboxylate transporter substrate binding protein [Variovorax sp. TBS-050B]MDH6591883.1 tripartite-type tricarboxylate transporter receptor subunit TctC [Variovorax sp. TBS-050B]
MKRRFLPLLAAALALAAASLASAQPAAYPSQPIKWIVPYVAGGGTDNLARALAEAMQPSLGQPLIIDNRPGASTNIGVSVLMQSRPDGYTIMQAENAALLFNEHMFAKLPYKPASDFTYIGTIGRFPVALVVHPDFPARNVAEFVRHVKAHPDKVNYASPGNGSPHHMAMELFKQKAGIQLTHVPYKGAAPAMTDVMGGQVPTMMLDLASGLPIIKAGKVRVLAIALPQRAGALPEVPTFSEAGFSDVNAYAFHGLIGPAGMPAEAVARINAELRKAMGAPRVVKLFSEFGFEPLPGTPQEFYRLSRAESERWGRIIAAANVKLD